MFAELQEPQGVQGLDFDSGTTALRRAPLHSANAHPVKCGHRVGRATGRSDDTYRQDQHLHWQYEWWCRGGVVKR